MQALATSERFSATSPDLSERVAKAVNEEGYAIVTGALDASTCGALIAEVGSIERDHGIDYGKNDFEGFQTRRIFNLIQRILHVLHEAPRPKRE